MSSSQKEINWQKTNANKKFCSQESFSSGNTPQPINLDRLSPFLAPLAKYLRFLVKFEAGIDRTGLSGFEDNESWGQEYFKLFSLENIAPMFATFKNTRYDSLSVMVAFCIIKQIYFSTLLCHLIT